MSRIMFDSINSESLPSGSKMVAGYTDGSWPNYGQLVARFPQAICVDITVNPNHSDRGRVLDVESGDASPAEAPGWVLKRRLAGVDPSVYCNSDTWPLVRQAFADAGVPEPHYWIAQYDGDPTIPDGAVAKQYASQGAYDTSSVADYWPGIDPPQEEPVTPQDIEAIVKGVWYFQTTDTQTGQATPMEAYLRYQDQLREHQTAEILAAIKGLNDTVGQLSQALSKLTAAEQAPGA